MSVPVHQISAVIQAVEAAIGAQPVLRRIPAQKRTAFALDLALIALACR
jgi:hypothetical protein